MHTKIKEIRMALGLSENQISSFLNISSYKYRRFENGSIEVPVSVLILLANIYDLSIDEIIFNKVTVEYILKSLPIIQLLNYPLDLKLKVLGERMCCLCSFRCNSVNYKVVNNVQKNMLKKLSHNLVKLRIENKIEVFEISKELNITIEEYLIYEEGKCWPNLYNIIKLSQLFSVSVSCMFI